jgi:signal transduction histidine kinase
MEAMVTSLLESARLRHAAATLNLKTVNMGDLIRSLALDFKDRPPGVATGPLVAEPVSVDPEKIKTVLRNLLDNGLKHTPEDGPAVSISMIRHPDCIAIVVEDQGEGIPASSLPHLFEPFYRPDTSPLPNDRRIRAGAQPVQGHRRCPWRHHRPGQHAG